MKDLTKIKGLVFKGGSVKGIAYVAALYALETAGMNLTNIERVAGTSAGAIFAMLLAIDYRPDQLLKELSETSFSTFLDDEGLATQGAVLKTVDKLAHEKSPSIAKIPAAAVAPILATRILKQYGIYEGEKLRLWFEDKLFNVTKIHDITFAELFALKGMPEYAHLNIKDLYVVGFNLNEGRVVVFNHLNTPDVIIADAVRLSMSIPYFFRPHYIYKKINGVRTVDDRDLFVDAGLTHNYFIKIFDDHHSPETTLGLNLVSDDKIDYYLGLDDQVPRNDFDSVFGFSQAIIRGMQRFQEQIYLSSPDDRNRSIHISSSNIGTLRFNLTISDQQTLLRCGWRGVCEFLENNQLAMPEKLRSFLEDIISAKNTKVKPSISSGDGKEILLRENWCIINIWTSEKHPTLPGTNVGHVSIETKGRYMSFWPNRERVSSKADKGPQFFQRYYRERGPDFKLSYQDDVNAEHGVHANVRIVLYGLNIGKMVDKFESCKKDVTSWRLIGSNAIERLFGASSENCASTAYQLLVEGGMYEQLASKGSGQRSGVSSVVRPDDLLPHVVDAKRQEIKRFPDVTNWHHIAETTLESLENAMTQQQSRCSIL